jgi:nucleotide-binding universal stress UspA family protein
MYGLKPVPFTRREYFNKLLGKEETMRILGCLDGTNGELIGCAVQMFGAPEALTIALLAVMDVGPRRDIDRIRERFWRPPMHHEPVIGEMQAAETAAAQETLNAGLNYAKGAETLVRQGRPELEIVNAAAEWKADVIVIGAREGYGDPTQIGPRSVGHVARFVLDHAPCPVLLVRPRAHEQFPIDR